MYGGVPTNPFTFTVWQATGPQSQLLVWEFALLALMYDYNYASGWSACTLRRAAAPEFGMAESKKHLQHVRLPSNHKLIESSSDYLKRCLEEFNLSYVVSINGDANAPASSMTLSCTPSDNKADFVEKRELRGISNKDVVEAVVSHVI